MPLVHHYQVRPTFPLSPLPIPRPTRRSRPRRAPPQLQLLLLGPLHTQFLPRHQPNRPHGRQPRRAGDESRLQPAPTRQRDIIHQRRAELQTIPRKQWRCRFQRVSRGGSGCRARQGADGDPAEYGDRAAGAERLCDPKQRNWEGMVMPKRFPWSDGVGRFVRYQLLLFLGKQSNRCSNPLCTRHLGPKKMLLFREGRLMQPPYAMLS